MAHTKAIGTTKNGRDSQPSFRGVKLSDGQKAHVGNILVRQAGSSVVAGIGVRTGSDYTLYAITDGTVKFSTRRKMNYDGSHRVAKVVSIVK